MNPTAVQYDRVIGLAAVIQACHAVHLIATTGQVDSTIVTPLLNSLLQIQADNTVAVYGDLSAIQVGLEQLHRQLTQTKTRDEILQIQYAVNILRLERKLAKYESVMAIISEAIAELPTKLVHFDTIEHPSIIASIANTYKQTISNITPFIKVQGEAIYLQNHHNANMVRALLLTAIRAAIIWHQKGGRTYHLLWQSKKLTAITTTLQQEAADSQSSV